LGRVKKDDLVFYNGVAERIRHILKRPALGVTTAWLARRIGWNRASLSNFLNGTSRTIPAHFLPKIAEALNVSVGYLMQGDAQAGAKQSYDGNL
jgi:transcriptional regulator with XRE-family HTH domain